MTEKGTDTPEKKSNWQLSVAGAGYVVGDMAMATAAHLRGDPDVFKGALIWLAGGLAAARYGHPSPERQLQMTADKLTHYLAAQGVAIPNDQRTQNVLLRKPSFLDRCEAFFYEHPSEMLNTFYAIGAGYLVKDGLKDIRTGGKKIIPRFTQGFNLEGILGAMNGISKELWMGGLIGAGAVAGLVIKEKPDAREKAEHGNWFDKAVAAIEEKPLRLTAALYGANNIFTCLRFLEDRHHSANYGTLKPHWFSGATAATYILSNAALATVSRDRDGAQGLAPSAIATLEDAAARVIAAQSPEAQAHLLKGTAELLAKQKNIRMDADDIAQALADRIALLTKERLQAGVEQAKWTQREEARLQSADVAHGR